MDVSAPKTVSAGGRADPGEGAPRLESGAGAVGGRWGKAG